MNNTRLYAVLSVFLVAALFVYVYFAHYQTKVTAINAVKQQLQAEQELIAVFEQQAQNSEPQGPIVVTGSLQNKVPVKPMSDKLMLDFEKAELLSDSLITSIVFTEGEEETAAEPEAAQEAGEAGAPADEAAAQEEQQAAEPAEENVTDATEEQVEQEEQPLPAEVLPEGIRKIRAQLTVESPSYEEMEMFIVTLEKQMRMLRIEQLQFTGPQEAQEVTDNPELLAYNITVAAYYMPELIELLDDSPELDTPDPANKENPFVEQ